MSRIHDLIRPNIRELSPYSSARDEFSGQAHVWLDANESPFENGLNRYPDPYQRALKEALSKEKNIPTDQIFLGHGSDEVIDLLFRAFCEPGQDCVLTFPPTYGMYAVSAGIQNISVIECPLDEDFQPAVDPALKLIKQHKPKLIFLCSPNNPTGNLMDPKRVEAVLAAAPGLVVIDEAYIDFAEAPGWIDKISQYEQLVVMHTFSKARGHAGIRLGVGFGSSALVSVLNRIKPPYNVSTLTQEAAQKALKSGFPHLQKIRSERVRLHDAFEQSEQILRVYPSEANFLLVEVDDARAMYQQLLDSGLVVRDRSNVVKNALRITVGTPAENDRLLTLLHGKQEAKTIGRTAEVRRKTKETDICVRINLDGQGQGNIHTGLGFFDHMLEQVSRHGLIDLDIQVLGDLHIDEHHTVEDTALALGEAFSKALGDKRGVERYGFLLPMDESLAQVAIDFGGRPWLVWKANFKRERVGEMPTEMFEHFFKSFSDTAKCNLNIQVTGSNEHHMIEAIFKGFARAIKMAVRKDNSGLLPSTKGTL